MEVIVSGIGEPRTVLNKLVKKGKQLATRLGLHEHQIIVMNEDGDIERFPICPLNKRN